MTAVAGDSLTGLFAVDDETKGRGKKKKKKRGRENDEEERGKKKKRKKIEEKEAKYRLTQLGIRAVEEMNGREDGLWW